jgi:isopentenyl diphosphate isomerase/L-lactate dehydrogenase-like FMN-dependent dehydrogenase
MHARPAPVYVAEYEAFAEAVPPRGAFDNVTGGAEDELTLQENLGAFRRWRVHARVLTGVGHVTMTTCTVGCTTAFPSGCACRISGPTSP